MRILLIIILIAIVVGVIYWYRKPRISINSIDWLNKSVNYTISAGGANVSGVQSINDTLINRSPIGGYNIYIESNPGGSFNSVNGINTNNPVIKIGILKNGTIVVGNTIDFTNKTNSPSLSI